MNGLTDLLKKWPLLLVGLALFLWGISLTNTDEDKSDARALLLGVASVLIGAGIVVVVGTEVIEKSGRKGQHTYTKETTYDESSSEGEDSNE